MRSRIVTRGIGSVLSCMLVAMSGCGDEVGGDGWVQPRAGTAGALAEGGEQDGGGSNEGGAAGHDTGSGGKAGKGGSGGRAPMAGTAGTINEAGMGTGGEPGGAVCGNGVTEAPAEDCDDGNTAGGDECPAHCRKACEVCEQEYCTSVRSAEAGDHGWVLEEPVLPSDLYAGCFEMPGTAMGGPAQGVSRAELCLEAVDCVRREKCEQVVPDDSDPTRATYAFTRCFCDLDISSPNYISACSSPDTFQPGKCQREFQEASEKDTTGVFGGVFAATANAFGAANTLLLACDRKLCLEECLPHASVGAVANISADILWIRNDAGESQLGNLIADAHRSAMGTDFAFLDFDVDTFHIDFYGSAGLRFAKAPGRGADADGRVLQSEVSHALFGMDPRQQSVYQHTGTKLVTMQLTGQQVYDVLKVGHATIPTLSVSGLTYTWDAAQPADTRITEVRKAGTVIDKAASYSVTVNDELAATIIGASNVVMTDKNPLQELLAYLRAQPQAIAPPPLNRVVRLN